MQTIDALQHNTVVIQIQLHKNEEKNKEKMNKQRHSTRKNRFETHSDK